MVEMNGGKEKKRNKAVSCVVKSTRTCFCICGVESGVYVEEEKIDGRRKKEFQILKDRGRVGKYIQNGRTFVIVIMGRG